MQEMEINFVLRNDYDLTTEDLELYKKVAMTIVQWSFLLLKRVEQSPVNSLLPVIYTSGNIPGWHDHKEQ